MDGAQGALLMERQWAVLKSFCRFDDRSSLICDWFFAMHSWVGLKKLGGIAIAISNMLNDQRVAPETR